MTIPSGADRTQRAVHEALDAAREDLSAAQEQRQDLDELIEELQGIVGDLESLAAVAPASRTAGRQAQRPAAKAATRRGTRARGRGGRRGRGGGESRTDAVARVLQEAGGPLTLREITERLAQKGRPDDSKRVSAALSYLAKKDRVTRSGEGGWAAT